MMSFPSMLPILFLASQWPYAFSSLISNSILLSSCTLDTYISSCLHWLISSSPDKGCQSLLCYNNRQRSPLGIVTLSIMPTQLLSAIGRGLLQKIQTTPLQRHHPHILHPHYHVPISDPHHIHHCVPHSYPNPCAHHAHLHIFNPILMFPFPILATPTPTPIPMAPTPMSPFPH